MYEYVRLPTIEESFRANGERHLERAIAYASAGYPSNYYEGSMKKAIKNLKIADEFKIPEYLVALSDKLSVDIADAILYGMSVYKVADGKYENIGLQGLLKDQ